MNAPGLSIKRMRSSLLAGLAALPLLSPVWADDASLPGDGFAAEHYEKLWTQSPFAVASADSAATPESSDYQIVGIARFDGVSYASLIDKQSQEHFLLSDAKPIRGLKLISITEGKTTAESFAVVQKNGESLTLKLEPPATGPVASVPGMPPQIPMPNPAIAVPQIPMPGTGVSQPGMEPPHPPPAVNFRRRLIRVPPPPDYNQTAQPGAPH